MVSSLAKLERGSNTVQLYNESLTTLEKLAILKAWAEVYIVAMVGNGSAPDMMNTKGTSMSSSMASSSTTISDDDKDFESKGESLLNLVQPELVNLSHYWLAALRDHALLSLPPGKF